MPMRLKLTMPQRNAEMRIRNKQKKVFSFIIILFEEDVPGKFFFGDILFWLKALYNPAQSQRVGLQNGNE